MHDQEQEQAAACLALDVLPNRAQVTCSGKTSSREVAGCWRCDVSMRLMVPAQARSTNDC